MIPYEDALSLVLETVGRLGTEDLPVAAAVGRVLAQTVVAQVDNPPFNKAAMDGFAVRACDVEQLPADLKIVGAVSAGGFPDFRIGPGEASRITTGSPVPDGADVVVKVEDTEASDADHVRVLALSGGNICPRAEDVRRGETVLEPGLELTPLRVGVAASAGSAALSVYRRPRVALLCTGTEVVEPGAGVGGGQIYNSNGPMLAALLAPWAEEFTYLGVVGDDPDALKEAVRRGLEADLFAISGGVSVSEYDMVPPTLEGLGARCVFHKCAMKPGKPTWFGRREGTVVFGIPGNPLSCFVVCHVLVRPAISRLIGLPDAAPAYHTGLMAEGFKNSPGRRNFLPCKAQVQEGALRLHCLPSHGSADIVGASTCNALLTVPPDCSGVEAGEELRFLFT